MSVINLMLSWRWIPFENCRSVVPYQCSDVPVCMDAKLLIFGSIIGANVLFIGTGRVSQASTFLGLSCV